MRPALLALAALAAFAASCRCAKPVPSPAAQPPPAESGVRTVVRPGAPFTGENRSLSCAKVLPPALARAGLVEERDCPGCPIRCVKGALRLDYDCAAEPSGALVKTTLDGFASRFPAARRLPDVGRAAIAASTPAGSSAVAFDDDTRCEVTVASPQGDAADLVREAVRALSPASLR